MKTYTLTSRTRNAISTLIYSMTSSTDTDTRNRKTMRRIYEPDFCIEYDGIKYEFEIYDREYQRWVIYNEDDIEWDGESVYYVSRSTLKAFIDALHVVLDGRIEPKYIDHLMGDKQLYNSYELCEDFCKTNMTDKIKQLLSISEESK